MHNLFFAYKFTIGNKEGASSGRGKCHYSLAHLIAVAVFQHAFSEPSRNQPLLCLGL